MTAIFDVICIGAALIDIIAQVERHPIEDDEVFVSNLKLLSGGAAANTAYACAKLGLLTAFLGKLGLNDAFGAKIIKDFEKVKVATTLIKYSNNYSTGTAYIALNKEGDRRIYAHSGAANYLSKNDINERDIELTKVIFLSSLKNLEPFIKAATIGKTHRIPVILNPGMLIIDQGLKNISKLLKKINILILSLREYKTLLNLQGNEIDNEAIKEKVELFWKFGIKAIVVTMGEKGAILLNQEISDLIPSIKVGQTIDTTGAGDAFSAGFIYGFVQNLSFEFKDLKKDVKIGNWVAGKCIQELGARNGIPIKEDLNNFLINIK
ncbi:MAG: carbohydrate kinase family protein [Promethearchaeota archaeon]